MQISVSTIFSHQNQFIVCFLVERRSEFPTNLGAPSVALERPSFHVKAIVKVDSLNSLVDINSTSASLCLDQLHLEFSFSNVDQRIIS